MAATAAMRVDDADAEAVDERGDEHRAEDERDGAPRVGLVPALLLLLLLMLIGAGESPAASASIGVVDRPRVREGPQSPHPARGGGARHDAAPASSDTADAVDAYGWCTTNGDDGPDGATGGGARGGAGRRGARQEGRGARARADRVAPARRRGSRGPWCRGSGWVPPIPMGCCQQPL